MLLKLIFATVLVASAVFYFGQGNFEHTALPIPAPSPTPREVKAAVTVKPSYHTPTSPINEYRNRFGLPGAKIGATACNVASKRVSEIKGNFSHAGFLDHHALVVPGTYYENLGRGYATFVDVLAAWKKSPSHNRNLLEDYQQFCVKSSGTYWVFIGFRK